MKNTFTLVMLFLLISVVTRAQVNLICNAGGSVSVLYSGGLGKCVTTAPLNGNIQYSIGTNCNDASIDPVAREASCGCCPVFSGDCIKYTNTVSSAVSDQFVIGEITYNVAILTIVPVRLTNIKAYEKNAAVLVEWTIRQEMNIDRYELERSQTGEQFVKIGALPSKGNSEIMRNYMLTDQQPVSGVNFYRVKTVAKSGGITFSPVVKVNRNISSAELTIAPNPVTGNMATLHYNLPEGNYMVSIISGSGQQVFTGNLQHSGGSAAQTIEFPKALASGIYSLKLAGAGIVIQKKMIK